MTKRKTFLRMVSMLTAVVLCIVGVPWSMQIVTYAESNQNRTKNFKKSYSKGSTKAETMLNIAKAQIDKSGSNLGYTENWCADFVSDCAALAGYGSAVPHNCDCDSLYNAILDAGGASINKNEARPGDIVFYDKPGTVYGANHVEIVSSGTGESLLSIGGNTGSDYVSSAVVCSPRNHPWPIIYIARPNGSGNPPPSPWIFKIENAPKCSSTRWIGSGSVTSGDDVKWVQTALNLANNAGLTVDGVWGTKSKNATIAFQKKYGLTADGQAGKNTIDKLVEVIKQMQTPVPATPVASVKYSSPRTITYNWNPVSGATSYKITFRKSGDEYAVKEENFKGTSYTISNLAPNTKYWFRVYAKNSSGTSAHCESVGCTTPANVDVGTDFFAYIVHAQSGKVIDRDDNDNVILMKKNPSCMAQIWRFVKQSDGSYVIYNGKNKEFKGVLDSTGTNTSGSNVYVYPKFAKSNAQYWYIFGSNNDYSLYTKCTDCTMDLTNYNTKDGTNIQMATYFGNTAQKFKIEKVSCPHNYGSWTISKAATCTADGTQTRKCSICGNTESKTIAESSIIN